MNTMYRVFWLFGLVLLLPAFLHKENPPTHEGQRIYAQFLRDKNQLHQQLQELDACLQTNAPVDSLQARFKRSRQAYKRLEWLLEYYQPFVANRVNGPPVAEVEEEEPGQTPIRPTGLQVIEPLLFPTFNPAHQDSLTRELHSLLTYTAHLEQSIPAQQLTDASVLEAIRQQFFRVQVLGITGYDAPETQTGLSEAAVSLRALHEAFRPYTDRLPPALAISINEHWAEAIQPLEKATNFTNFDRVDFIRQHLYPLCRLVQQARQSLRISAPTDGRFLSTRVATLSDSGAFQPDFLINFGSFRSSPQKVALGEILFFDPILSGNNARSCASCHQPERAFTDGRIKSRAFRGRKSVLRNAPTLLNAGLQNAQFFDSRVFYLEDQAHDVLRNAHEMQTSPEAVVQKLTVSAAYMKQFTTAFPDGLTAANVRNALACYVRSLTSLNARPDRYLRGEGVGLSADERLGFNLFLGKARCATCHFFPIYNGFIPPNYEKTESEIIGVPERPKIHNARLDPDAGKYMTYQKDIHRFAFKTPTVRNVGLTAPYMHNGVYQTLDQVVDFYNRGGGRGIGIALEGQTLPEKPLDLSPGEQKALVAFLQSLTDTTGLASRPRLLPVIGGNSKLNRRKLGGRY